MSDYSRRQFLHDSFLAAAATAAAGPVSHLLAAESTSSIPSKGANEKLGILVCGVHDRGKSHLGGFEASNKNKALNTEVIAICDADSNVGGQACEATAKAQGGRKPTYYQDIRQALEDKAVDCVSIAMPNHWHALAAIWAMQHGKDVYVEKPVCHNIWEGQQMVATARNLGKICQTGTQCRSNQANIEAVEFIRSGKIGDVNLAHGLCYKGRASIGPPGEYDVPSNIDYNMWRGPAPMAEKSPYRGVVKEGKPVPVHYDWHWNWLFGNGDLGNQGIHQMDIARWGLGVDQLANGVLSYGGRFGYTDAGNTPNTDVVVLDYGPKTLVFEVRGLRTEKLHNAGVGVIFTGTDGYVVMTEYTEGAAFDKDWKKIRDFKGGGNHFANFISAVRSRNHEDLHADIQDGFLSSALCHMGNISYRLGDKVATAEIQNRLKAVKMLSDDAQDTLDRTVEHLSKDGVKLEAGGAEFQCGPYLKFDPKAYKFADSKANEQLTRDYRKGFEVKDAGKV